MAAMARRVLAIEDDASMQRLLRLAVEDDPVEIYLFSNVPDAVVELKTSSFDLIITDLMLPGESGIGLINRFCAHPSLRGQAELVVLSAGITPQQTAELKLLGVNGFLLKPVSMARLRQLLLHGFSVPIEPGPIKTDPVHVFFEGNQTLFDQFAAHCAIQFEVDCKQGDDAESLGDLSGIYTIAHSLSAALEMLGEKEMATQCRTLMRLTKEAGQSSHALQAWRELSKALQGLYKGLRLKALQ